MIGQKEHKNLKGNLGEIMPDFRHAVETVAESEGFNEIVMSEGFRSPKRKCISLNGERRWVPVQVLSISKMTRVQRKESEGRLKRELEAVRVLKRKVVSFNDVRSSSDVIKPERVVAQGNNGPRLNKGPVETPKQAVRTNSFDPYLGKLCLNLLNGLLAHKFGWVFKEPVDTVKLNIPDYLNVIKHPMDFGTIKTKLARGDYTSPMGFAADVRLTFSNAITYNPPKNDVHIMAQTLSKYFEQRWKPIEKKIPMHTDVPQLPSKIDVPLQNGVGRDQISPSKKKKIPMYTDVPQLPPNIDVPLQNRVGRDQISPSKKKKIPMYMDVPQLPSKIDVPLQNGVERDQNSPPKKKIAPEGYVRKVEPVKKVMTGEEKITLKTVLEDLLSDLPETIIDFLRENSSTGETSEDEIEIDIEALSDDVLFKLKKLLDDLLLERKKQQIMAEPCEMELHNDSGLSNLSIQPGKGNDAADEDIDIEGNDLPVSRFPPEEIVKDIAKKNNRHSSLNTPNSVSGSSSSSSSSSSDSDSSSSSNQSEGARAVPPGDKLQGLDAKSNLEQHRNNFPNEVCRDQSENSLSQLEQTFHTKPPSVEVEGNKGGESAASKGQVSPDKLHRAALLKSRFADTILKAQEKTLEKGEKRDPEKLRLEREELERRQRKEKARLQAEVKAAEEAQKKAEAEAAAETKRKRGLEREAARMALQKMEKTVDINESGQFMEDLELLSAVPADDLSSLMGNVTPDDTQNGGLASFIYRGNSNPLEKLGLYRKDDDEEDEDVELHHNALAAAVNDVEEGEID